ncbi:hypothetical protein PITCH_A2030196 [uncultured Desulfobacterium sp.]|uniref:Uncharacterized protein n=1 Tax=uncultured Desulfobacterium sp. TaxID=201089 RepID=A0A445MXF1_9BACT|nr:hypothetical protein PITCH_A2030196 [uncultured Desulfobacterium sp.]
MKEIGLNQYFPDFMRLLKILKDRKREVKRFLELK